MPSGFQKRKPGPTVTGSRQASRPTKTEVWRRISANCRYCLYDPHAGGTWREQIEACTSPDCPMYPIRPVSQNYKAP
jgi:hypothetical protein